MRLLRKFWNWFAVQNRLARAGKLLFATTEQARAENTDLAIAIYEEALTIATRYHYSIAPEETCFNLGLAYAVRINGDVKENRSKAFQFLQRAIGGDDLGVQQSQAANSLLALGTLLATRARQNLESKKAPNFLEKAIAYELLAAKLYENVNDSKQSARTQLMLSLHHLMLDEARVLLGRRQARNTEQAIYHAEQARKVFQDSPEAKELQAINLILGLLFYVRSEGNRNENSERAAQFLEPISKDTTVDPVLAEYLNSFLIEEQFVRAGLGFGEKVKKVNEHIDRLWQIDSGSTPLDKQKLIADKLLSSAMYHSAFLRNFAGRIDSHQLEHFYQRVMDVAPALGIDDANSMSIAFRLQKELFGHLEEGLSYISEADWKEFSRYLFNGDLFKAFGMIRKKNPLYLKSFGSEMEQALRKRLDKLDSSYRKMNEFDWATLCLEISGLYSGLINLTVEAETQQSDCRQVALLYFKEAFNVLQPYPQIFSITDCAMTFGVELLFRGKFWDEAEVVFRSALESQDEQYRLAATEKSRQFILKETGYAPFSLILRYAYVLARQGRAAEAVEVLERWRGRQLTESLQSSKEMLLLAEAEDRHAYLEVTSEIDRLQKELRSSVGLDNYDTSRRLESLRARREEIIARSPSYSPGFLAAPVYTEIQKTASANKPILYLIVTELGSLVLAVLSTGLPICLWLDDFTQGNMLSSFYDYDTGKRLTSSRFLMPEKLTAEIMPELARKFAAPLRDFLRQQNATGAYLIPCGSLSILPLHTAADAEAGCLIDHFDIHFVPTSQALAAALQNLPAHQPEAYKLLALGDPRDDLASAVAETASLSNIFESPHSACALFKEAATLSKLKENLKDVTHLHFACHGRFDGDNPLDSALLLANGQSLTLRTLLNEPDFASIGKARLVVLSACQTALSDYLQLPEEAIGLLTGFLRTGVPGVVGTLWPVDDLSTAILMVRFYCNLLRENLPPASALRQAQTWLRDATRNDLLNFCRQFPALETHDQIFYLRDAGYETPMPSQLTEWPYQEPYYWAGFILSGV